MVLLKDFNSRVENLVHLTFRKSEVITINAIVMTGILILLTLNGGSSVQGVVGYLEKGLIPYIKTVVAFDLIPFAISSIVEINDGIKNPQDGQATIRGLKWTRSGFWYLIAIAVMIGIIQLFEMLGWLSNMS